MSNFNNLSESRMTQDQQDSIMDSTDIVYWEEDVKNFIKELKINLVGLFDVYEIKIVNDGSELFLRDHEKRRMIEKEIDKLSGDVLVAKEEQ